MPKRTGGIGPGAMRMAGPGKRPPRPPTPFSAGGPGGGPGGPPMGGPRAMPSAVGAAGFKKGGSTEHEKKEKVARHEKGGAVHKDEAEDRALFKKMEKEEDKAGGERPGKREREHEKYAKGGAVIAGHGTHGMKGTMHPVEQGISKGSDSKRSAGPKGSESRTHRPHSGKSS